MNIFKIAVNKFFIFPVIYYCFLSVINSAFANDLNLTLNSIQPSHHYVCPVDKVISDKVEWFLTNSPNLSNQARSKLLWQKSTVIFCKYGVSDDYLRYLKKITLLPSNEVNKNILSIAIYDLTNFYHRYSPTKACDFLHENRLLVTSASPAFLKYLDMAELQSCAEMTAVEKIKAFVRLREVNKGDNPFIANIYMSIAQIYSSLGQFTLAANEFKKQLSHIKDDFEIHWSYYSIATELLDAGEIEEGKHYFRKFESAADLFIDTEDYNVLLLILKIKIAYMEKKFALMLVLIDEFEPYQSRIGKSQSNNKMLLYKAIACVENNRTQCINSFISKKAELIKQTKASNLRYLYEFLTKYYIAQNQVEASQKYFESYININQQALIDQQNSVSVLDIAELQQDIVTLELSLVSAKVEQSKITLVLSGLLIFVLLAIGLFIWREKNKQKILLETDELTRIYNRRAIFEQIANLKNTKNNDIHAIILFDLDNFKAINDKYSHVIGDKALRHIVKLTKDNIRQQDLFGRISGEEFVVCLKDLEKVSAQIIVERILSSFENNPMLLNDAKEIRVTASFSITYIEKSITDFESIYHSLDSALSKTKDLGRNRVVEV
ncbi:GGDEF domain-containing protein [Colwellia sp. MB02u-9]|uniref:GGDEF domain-containing protein n=1 Tax=Colwellia sp. MB02u-9 TaxID=2759823 RepID=UPI0015F7311F|nr:GGDEF domain-containing protein [Colwellia sp. MB02u-9]MBA6295791.1 GGDEF domain-containing protein [Colwellia sp. MB02u-9]